MPAVDYEPVAGEPLSLITRLSPGRRGVAALSVLAVVVAVVSAVIAVTSRPRVEQLDSASPAVVTVTRSSGVAVPGGSGPPGVPGSPAASAMIVVAVSGKVRRPGLVRLTAGARVADAIESAGGALPDADLSLVNLARKVRDGELIVVGLPGVVPGAADGGDAGVGGAPSGPVNLNTATAGQLQTLPGVGPVLANRIIEYRQGHGGFATVSDLRRVSGIGDARYNELRDLVTV